MMVAVVTMVAIVTVIAVVTMVAVVTGVRRRSIAGQRYGERHRRYRVEKGLQVHFNASCSPRNLRALYRAGGIDYRARLTCM
jgi:hypothetical protein